MSTLSTPTAEAQQALINAEAKEFEDAIETVINTDVLPYKEGAPLCDNFVGTTAIAHMSKYLGPNGTPGPIQMPSWTHGQCIGAACARWKETSRGGICGKAIGDLADALRLGLIEGDDDETITKEFERWALPSDEKEEE